MRFPSPDRIEVADVDQLVMWQENLPSPGEFYHGREDFEEMIDFECSLMEMINTRLNMLGGKPEKRDKIIGDLN